MREIKLRWTFKRKEDGHIYQIVGDIDLLRESNGLTEMFKNELWELVGREQYVGMKDRNGREIYEGDIVKTNERIWIIKWDADGGLEDGSMSPEEWIYGYRFPHPAYEGMYMEIIGNPHENPELVP